MYQNKVFTLEMYWFSAELLCDSNAGGTNEFLKQPQEFLTPTNLQ